MAIKRISTYNNNEENNDNFGVVTVHQNQFKVASPRSPLHKERSMRRLMSLKQQKQDPTKEPISPAKTSPEKSLCIKKATSGISVSASPGPSANGRPTLVKMSSMRRPKHYAKSPEFEKQRLSKKSFQEGYAQGRAVCLPQAPLSKALIM